MPRTFTDEAGTQHVFEDGTPDSVVARVLGRVAVKGHVRGAPKRATGGSGLLPAIGGGVGGIRGGVLGAAAGGSIGEAFRQVIDRGGGTAISNATPFPGPVAGILNAMMEPEHAVTDAGTSLGRIAGAGATQGGYQVAGNVISAGANLVGKGAMNMAMKFTPEAAQTAIREGISATRGGIQKATSLLGQIGRKTQAAIRGASPGARMNSRAVAQIVEERVTTALKRQGIHGEDLQQAAELANKFMRDNPGRFDLSRAFEIKKTSGNLARPLHERIAAGQAAAAAENISPVRQLWEKEMEKFLDERLGVVVPGYHELNSRASDLIRLKNELNPVRKGGAGPFEEAARRAATPIGRTLTGATLGAGTGAALPGDRGHNAEIGALLGALAGNPAAMSQLALLLYSPAFQGVAKQAPRVIGAVAQ